MRARRAAERGPGRERAAAGGGPARRGARDPHPVRVPGPVQVEPRLGPARREGARARRPAPLPAARTDDRRLRLDQRDDLPARQPARLRRLGRRAAPPAGRTTRCSRTSSAPRTTSAARTSSTASAGRSPSRRAARCSRSSTRCSRRRSRPGTSTSPTSTSTSPEGVSRFQVNQRNGKRWSTADAYLHPASDRPNLEVRTSVLAQRIVFEGDRAVGVEIVADGKAETVRAEREVIVSAGAYQSPVLLMLSGIGPEEDLSLFGIPVRENLPVGPQPPGPLHGERQLHDRRARPVRHPHAGELRAARDGGPRPAQLEHPGGRRLLPLAGRPRRAGHRVPLRALDLLRRGPERADRARATRSGRC